MYILTDRGSVAIEGESQCNNISIYLSLSRSLCVLGILTPCTIVCS